MTHRSPFQPLTVYNSKERTRPAGDGQQLMDTPGVTHGLPTCNPLGQPGTEITVFSLKCYIHFCTCSLILFLHTSIVVKKTFYFEIELISGENDSWCMLVSRRMMQTYRHNLRS